MTKELLYELSKNSLGKHIMVAQLAAKLYQKHRNKPLTFTVSVLGSITCVTNKQDLQLYAPSRGLSKSALLIKRKCHNRDCTQL